MSEDCKAADASAVGSTPEQDGQNVATEPALGEAKVEEPGKQFTDAE
jgi:hypothetical protein